LEDITLRVLRILEEVDVIAAEDTRQTIKLLNHFEIKTPLESYHEHNKFQKTPILIKALLEGKNIALVTDAGTPAISDPGEELAREAFEAGISVTSLPGAAAVITGLTLSGLSTRRFAFEGFLPQEKKERARVLERLKENTYTTVFYEAPHRLNKTLEAIAQVIPGDRKLSVCRELTKKHETIIHTTLEHAISYFEENPPKGEIVFILEGADIGELEKKEQEKWEEISLQEHMERYLSQGIERKAAMKAVAKDRGMTKNEVYKGLLQ
jgi:16S rRNA (cytidine1402-2'-O)-methyltransferase